MKSQETPIYFKDTGMLWVCYGYVMSMLITPQPFGGIIGTLVSDIPYVYPMIRIPYTIISYTIKIPRYPHARAGYRVEW